MAIYHLAAQVLGRGPGRKNFDGSRRTRPDSAVAAAAYRAGAKLHDERAGTTRDYARRDGVVHAEILVPEGGAAWLADRERLWNEVERLESRRDAQLARDLNIALPHELTDGERRALLVEFVREQFVAQGMVADIAIHAPVPRKGDDPRNHHAHVMLTLRKATSRGLHEVKTRAWNARSTLQGWREAWEDHANRALERAGHRARIDHRRLAAQRDEARQRGDRINATLLDRTPEIHVGPRPTAMRRRGAEPVSRPRERGVPRFERPPYQVRPAEPRQSLAAFRRERAAERDRAREEGAERRLAQARARWARKREREAAARASRLRTQAWAERRLSRVHAGMTDRDIADAEAAWYRVQSPGTRRRQVDYPRIDAGPRIGKLWDILTGNNVRAKRDLARIQRRMARFDRWIDHFDRKATLWIDRMTTTRQQRFLRWQAAEAERAEAARKAEHARRRAAQMREITTALRQMAAALGFRLEGGLARTRQVEGWTRAAVRPRDREADQGRLWGQGRSRTDPNGPSGRST